MQFYLVAKSDGDKIRHGIHRSCLLFILLHNSPFVNQIRGIDDNRVQTCCHHQHQENKIQVIFSLNHSKVGNTKVSVQYSILIGDEQRAQHGNF